MCLRLIPSWKYTTTKKMISRARPKYQDLYDGERAMSGILQLAKHLKSNNSYFQWTLNTTTKPTSA